MPGFGIPATLHPYSEDGWASVHRVSGRRLAGLSRDSLFRVATLTATSTHLDRLSSTLPRQTPRSELRCRRYRPLGVHPHVELREIHHSHVEHYAQRLIQRPAVDAVGPPKAAPRRCVAHLPRSLRGERPP